MVCASCRADGHVSQAAGRFGQLTRGWALAGEVGVFQPRPRSAASQAGPFSRLMPAYTADVTTRGAWRPFTRFVRATVRADPRSDELTNHSSPPGPPAGCLSHESLPAAKVESVEKSVEPQEVATSRAALCKGDLRDDRPDIPAELLRDMPRQPGLHI